MSGIGEEFVPRRLDISLLLCIVVEKHLGLLNSCCPDNGEQRAWAVFKLHHAVASRDVAQCLS